MTRLGLLLLAALIASSVWLVRVTYESRRLYAALDKAQVEQRALEVEGERLRTELRSQATPLRVERTARDRLAMRPATPGVTQYVELRTEPAATAVAASASAGAEGARPPATPQAPAPLRLAGRGVGR